MRFKIYRTDEEYNNDAPSPCKNAIKVSEEVPEVKYRTNINEKGELVYYGTEKTITKSHWEVEINTLEDFIALQEEVEHPLIFFGVGEDYGIEIYDNYRE